VVLWFLDDACRAGFHDLFSLPQNSRLNVLDILDQPLSRLSDNQLNFDITTLLTNHSQVFGQAWAAIYPTKFLIPSTHFHSINGIYIHTRGVHTIDSMNCQTYLQLKQQFYQELQPALRLQSLIQTVKVNYFNTHQHIVGIHIRAFDNAYDWAMVAPHLSSLYSVSPSSASIIIDGSNQEENQKQAALRFDQISSFSNFRSLISNLINHQPETTIFVASNSDLVKETILQEFGDTKIITLLEAAGTNSDDVLNYLSSSRSQRQGMYLAVIEFFLLGETSTIFHTHASSFAREAAMRRLIPVLDIFDISTVSLTRPPITKDYLAFYSVDIQQIENYCALPEYIRSNSQETSSVKEIKGENLSRLKKFCFEEEGNRTMCSVVYKVCPCDQSLSTHSKSSMTFYCPTLSLSQLKDEKCYLIVAESNGYSI
jgi:hypothetical protein